MQTIAIISLTLAIACIFVLAYKIITSWLLIRHLKNGKSDITIEINSGKKIQLKSKYKQTSPQEVIDSMSVLFGE